MSIKQNKNEEAYGLPKSFIKNVAIQLRFDLELSNNPFEVQKKKFFSKQFYSFIEDIKVFLKIEKNLKVQQYYLGRAKHKKKFLSFLNTSKRGIYLVTGYRGMGKTSFVNHVLNEYIQSTSFWKLNTFWKLKKIIPIHLTLAQTNPREIDVLRQIVNSINDKYKSNNSTLILFLQNVIKYGIAILLLAVSLKIAVLEKVFHKEHTFTFLNYNIFTLSNVLTISNVISFIALLLVFSILKSILEYYNKASIKIRKLVKRCHAIVAEEEDNSLGYDFKIFNGKINTKKSNSYPIADTKLIEYELLEFLKLAKNREFIFIFDELDKMEMNFSGSSLTEDMESYEIRRENSKSHDVLRNRKQAVLSTITGLKNFFTTANARFIFIAGREMFDASLADIADKQSPLSSIFTYSFHIESLLKEEKEGHEGERNTSSLSNEVENFLKYMLLSSKDCSSGFCDVIDKDNNSQQRKKISLATYTELIKRKFVNPDKSEDDEKYLQVYILLQGFITYLVYRSNGSPKKLIRAFQEFVLTNADLKDRSSITTILYDADNDNPSKKHNKDKNYLYFDYYNQYRIGFINSFYRPFIIQNGRSYKLFSENTIISVPYLFDHLFKFHPFAFSISNLELIPEMMSYNKTPSLKYDLKRIINYLYNTHIRDTDVELFDYKFNSKTSNEITFISKIFEEESAAFNFTLDEGYPVKEHLNDMIKELRSIHSRYNTDKDNLNPQIFSIANLNTNLGDLYFFDQEFDDALNCYSDAIRSINNINVEQMNQRDFITLVSNKLKIGLCFEKTNSYRDALKFYSDSVQDIKRYFSFILNNANYVEIIERDNTLVYNAIQEEVKPLNDTNKKLYYTSSLNDLLQICIQSFLANLYVQEKLGLEGVNSGKVKVEFSDFYRIVESVGRHCNTNKMIIANGMLHHGKLLYFKNSSLLSITSQNPFKNNYPEVFLKKRSAIESYFNIVKEPNLTRRQPLLSFQIYLMGLDEVMRCRNFFDHHEGNKGDETFLFGNVDSNKNRLLNDYHKNLKDFVEGNNNKKEYSTEAYTANHYKYIASFLSGIGDCILGMSDMQTNGNSPGGSRAPHQVALCDVIDFSSSTFKTDSFFDILKTDDEINKLTLTHVLRCYYLAAQFYEKYGRISSACYEYRKILQVFMMILPDTESLSAIDSGYAVNANSFLENLQLNIVNKAQDLTSVAIDRTDTHMMAKIVSDTDLAKGHEKWPVNYLYANYGETKEVALIYEFIKLKLQDCNEDGVARLINPHYPISNQFLRITELDFYAKYLDKKIRRILSKSNGYDEKELKDCLFEYFYSKVAIIRTLYIYETDYNLGPAYVAYVHYSIAKMLVRPIKQGTFDDITVAKLIDTPEFNKQMTSLIGKSKTTFDSKYHYRKASDKYKIAIQLHTAGAEYHRQIKEMIYLEDDFNDNGYHFGAAYERYLMINDFFSDKITEIHIALTE